MARWMTFKEAASEYPTSESQLRKARDAGQLDTRKNGTRDIVSDEAVDDWFNRNCPTAKKG